MILIEENVECDFCGEIKPKVASTSRGNLCLGCMKLYMGELKESISEIEGKRRKTTNKNSNDKQLGELKTKADEALSKLFTGKVY